MAAVDLYHFATIICGTSLGGDLTELGVERFCSQVQAYGSNMAQDAQKGEVCKESLMYLWARSYCAALASYYMMISLPTFASMYS